MPDFLDILHREWPVIKQAPYSFVISILVIASIIWAIFEWRHRKRLEKQTTALVDRSGNSTATASIGDIHVHPSSPPTAAPTVPPVADAPNLAVTRVYRTMVYFKRSTIWSRFDSGSSLQMPFQAIFAEVKNARDDSRPVGEALGVRGELIVESSIGTTEYMPLPWFETECNTENFRFGDTHFLLLAVNLDRSGSIGDWRIVLNHRGFNDSTPGMEMEHFWTAGSEKKVRLNLLHIKRGTVICSVEGLYQLKKGLLDISFP